MKTFKLLFTSLYLISIISFSANCNKSPAAEIGEYEVTLTHTGYTLFSGTVQDCPIRSDGKVVLSGLLKGDENQDDEDDIIYNGILQLSIDMDICSSILPANGIAKLCGMTVTGSGKVNTQLTIYSDGQGMARGAYIQFDHDSTKNGSFTRSVVGNCSSIEMAEERTLVPNNTIASIFNGRDMPMLTNRRLVNGTYEERDNGHITVVVVRKVR